jgi:membrane protein implicated in regulation of membrane protease activity
MNAPPNGPELRDIHLPPPPPWWPPAPGWWLLAAVIVALAIVAIVYWRRRLRRRRAIAMVSAELDTAATRFASDGDRQALAASVSQLLRRIARQHDASAVTLRGAAWMALLQSLAPKLDITVLGSLDEAVYRPRAASDVVAALPTARRWVSMALAREPRATKAKRREAGDALA